jgi:hypothetical protein
MFAGTPRLRDLLDARSVLLVAAVALCAIGLQGIVLAGTVASPLGEAVAGLDRARETADAPAEAVAAARAGAAAPRPGGGATAPWDASIVVAAGYRPDPPAVCRR